MAVTDEKSFNENEGIYRSCAKGKEALKQHIIFSYPQWKLVDYDSLADATDMVIHEKSRLFPHGNTVRH